MSETITDYRADAIPSEHWAQFEGLVRDAVSAYGPSTPEQARRLMTILTRHVHWCWQSGAYPMDLTVLLRREVIAESVEKGMAHFAPRSRATYRSRLFAIADTLLTDQDRPAFVPAIAAASASTPYTAQEITLLRAWADGQSTDYRRVGAHLLLSLGLGAGLSAVEMVGVRASHVTVDDEGVLVNVQAGTRPRAVPVLAAWEASIASYVRAAFGYDQWLLGPSRTNAAPRGFVANFVATTNSQPFQINSHRLRATWIVHHLSIGTPVVVLSRAAGFESPQALGRYVDFVPDVEPRLARRLLHAAARAEGTMWKHR